MTLSESEIRVFTLPKVIKERSIGGEDTQLHSNRDRGRSMRERILAKKMEELTDRVTNLPSRKKNAQESVAKEVVLPYEITYSGHIGCTDSRHQLYNNIDPYNTLGGCTTRRITEHACVL